MPEKTENNNKLTTVKTIYARAAMLLLAVNFCLTTYVVVNLNKSVQMQVDQAAGVAPEGSAVTGPVTTSGASTTPSIVTREVPTSTSE